MSQSAFRLFWSSRPLSASLLILCLSAYSAFALRNASGARVEGSAGAGGWVGTGSASAPQVSIPDTSALPGETIAIPILVSDVTGMAGAEIKLTYDAEVLTALAVRTMPLSAGFVIGDTITHGRIAIALARATGIAGGSGPLAMITFRVASDALPCRATTIALAKLSFYDEKTDTISVLAKNGTFTVQCELPPPARLTVSPNPFTPNQDAINDTVYFNFGKIAAQPEVLIFNLSGNRVKRLSLARGRVVEWWDGRADDGHDLRPGVYLYLMKEDGNTIKKGSVTLMR